MDVSGAGYLLSALSAVALSIGCFLLGSVNPAAILAKVLGKDIRGAGSGNPGATNAGRVLGAKWGILVLVLDVLKAYLPTLVLLRAVGLRVALVGSLFIVLGHIFSPFLRGRGGKGVAAALGAMLAVNPVLAALVIVVFALLYAVVRFVGIASVLVSVGLVVVGLLVGFGVISGLAGLVDLSREEGWWLAVLGGIVLSRHQRNLRAWWLRRRRAATS